jgi:hypothetical protein
VESLRLENPKIVTARLFGGAGQRDRGTIIVWDVVCPGAEVCVNRIHIRDSVLLTVLSVFCRVKTKIMAEIHKIVISLECELHTECCLLI